MGGSLCVSLCPCFHLIALSKCVPWCILQGVLFYCLHPTALHQCCLQVALINGADPNNSSAAGVPVLVLACQRAPEFSSMGLSLLDQGADPNAVSQVNGRLKSPNGRLSLCYQDNACHTLAYILLVFCNFFHKKVVEVVER